MEHPAGVTDGDFWIGPEVEGPLALWRVQSVFIAHPFTLARLDGVNVAHVFLLASVRDRNWFEDKLVPWLTARGLPCTIECAATVEDAAEANEMRQCIPDARLVVRFFAERGVLDHLTGDDLVSVGAPYDLATFVLGEGVRSVPEDFEQDEVPS